MGTSHTQTGDTMTKLNLPHDICVEAATAVRDESYAVRSQRVTMLGLGANPDSWPFRYQLEMARSVVRQLLHDKTQVPRSYLSDMVRCPTFPYLSEMACSAFNNRSESGVPSVSLLEHDAWNSDH